jgi:hypothetical protein
MNIDIKPSIMSNRNFVILHQMPSLYREWPLSISAALTKQTLKDMWNKCWSQWPCGLRAAAHQLRQDKHQDMRQKLTSASWFRPVCGGFHNLIRFNCAPFFASCRRHRVLTVTCLDACRCAAYLRHEQFSLARTLGSWVRIPFKAWISVCIYSVFVLTCM